MSDNHNGNDNAPPPQDGSASEEDQDETSQSRVMSLSATAPAAAGNNGLVLDWTNMNNNGDTPMPIRYPHDVAEIDPNETELILVGTAGQKITNMGPTLSQEVNPHLKQLILRSHLIRTMEGLQNLTELELLELYDNQIGALACLNDGLDGAPGRSLRVLDMSYNVIRDMTPVEHCPNLRELYLANNKLKALSGLKELRYLQKIDLGANRIRVMDPDQLANLVELQELWLGKNKIEQIQGLEPLVKLRRLDVQSNRLTSVDNLTTQNETLEELYLAHNGITEQGASTPTGLAQSFPNLSVLDLSRNQLTRAPFGHLTSLDELWLSGNQIADFDALQQAISSLGQSLDTIYLEYNPIQQDPLYRKKLKQLLPSLSQIDANMITGGSSLPVSTTTTTTTPAIVQTMPASGETAEERARRLQEMAIERAKAESKGSKSTSE